MTIQTFRANAGIVVLDARGYVLALERLPKGSSNWQLPQGGIDGGEEPEAAAFRELREETGLSPADVELVGEYPEWLAYELPADKRSPWTGRGQVQRWFFVRIKPGVTVCLDPPDAGEKPEFGDYRWMPLQELTARVWYVRKPTYAKLTEYLPRVLASAGPGD